MGLVAVAPAALLLLPFPLGAEGVLGAVFDSGVSKLLAVLLVLRAGVRELFSERLKNINICK